MCTWFSASWRHFRYDRKCTFSCIYNPQITISLTSLLPTLDGGTRQVAVMIEDSGLWCCVPFSTCDVSWTPLLPVVCWSRVRNRLLFWLFQSEGKLESTSEDKPNLFLFLFSTSIFHFLIMLLECHGKWRALGTGSDAHAELDAALRRKELVQLIVDEYIERAWPSRSEYQAKPAITFLAAEFILTCQWWNCLR